MRRIQVDIPRVLVGRAWIVPVRVDWFPPLTPDQHLANGIAASEGREAPYPDLNMIEVEVRVAQP